MEQIISVTRSTSTSHVHIEVGRLLAGIIKYCNDKGIFIEILKYYCKCVQYLEGHDRGFKLCVGGCSV